MRKQKILDIIGIILISVALFVGVYNLYTHLSSKVKPQAGTTPEVTQKATTTATTEAQQSDEAQQPTEVKQSTATAGQKTQAPDFTVIDSNGKKVKLSDFKGKPVVLNFWATWCPYCVDELPLFESAYKNNSGISFLMVDAADGQRETVDIGKSFISTKGYTFPVYFDTALEAGRAYQLTSLPQTFFIDKDGNLVDSKIGESTAQTLQDGIDKIK